jgi:hypothetical protein
VRHDVGGWLSGPSADSRAGRAAAEHLREGDKLLLDDGTVATVMDVQHGEYWLNTGHNGPGVAVGWRSGSSRGVLFRCLDDVLYRVTW